MRDLEIAALDAHHLLPRVLHGVERVDTRWDVLDASLDSPIVPLVRPGAPAPDAGLAVVDADALLGAPAEFDPDRSLARLEPEKMGELMPKVRRLTALSVRGYVLDLTVLADTPPYGPRPWRPRTREDVAELRAAAGAPLWLYGVVGPDDAQVAAEAGIEAIIVSTGASARLGGPAAIDVLPEVIDAVAGMVGIYAGGPVRDGIDVFRYLAVGAEAVVTASDRRVPNLEEELRYAMRLTGCATLADISYDAIFMPLFGETS